MKVVVDVSVGRRGVRRLRDAGHEVIEAEHGEMDRAWFLRAGRDVEAVISPDRDLEVLCNDAGVVTPNRAKRRAEQFHHHDEDLACLACGTDSSVGCIAGVRS